MVKKPDKKPARRGFYAPALSETKELMLEEAAAGTLARYRQCIFKAGPGAITAQDFWRGMGVSPALEDEYLGHHRLNEGVIEFMRTCQAAGMEVWCLSNDVAEWSRKLRRRLELEE